MKTFNRFATGLKTLILTSLILIPVALPTLSHADQGVTLTQAQPRNPALAIGNPNTTEYPYLNNVGTNGVVLPATTNNLAVANYKWFQVTPGGTLLSLQSTVVSSATNAGNGILLIYGSDDGVTPTTSPVYVPSFALTANSATNNATSVVNVTTNAPYRWLGIGGYGNTAAAGTLTFSNVCGAFIPLQ